MEDSVEVDEIVGEVLELAIDFLLTAICTELHRQVCAISPESESDLRKTSHRGLPTEPHRQGRLPQHIFEADHTFTAQLASTEYGRTAHRGYMLWAQHVVSAMRASQTVTDVVEVFARPWAEHMAYVSPHPSFHR